MKQINAYLSFNGNCKEAMNFYKDCLGGELTLMAIKDMPQGTPCPEGAENDVMHSELKTEAGTIMATDMVAPGGLQQGNNFSLSVDCNSEEELHKKFNAVMKEGFIIEAPKMQFWGDFLGYGADKFGIRWMFNYSPARNS